MGKKTDPVAYARKIAALLKSIDYDIGNTAIRIAKELRWHEENSKPRPNFYSSLESATSPKTGKSRQ